MPSDHNNPLSWIDAALNDLERRDLRRHQATRTGAQSAHITSNGRDLINFGSNDYLGLADDERLIAAAHAAAQREGWGSGASPLVSGRSESHAALERRLAEFEGTEAALIFPSGFAANAGVIPALVDEGDAIFGDAKNHASLIDGCRLSKATRFIYPHCDCDALEKLLRETSSFRRRLIVTDTVFSMDGDLAPLARIVDLVDRYNAMLLLDEAHATGIFGPHARGIADHVEAACESSTPVSAGSSPNAFSSTLRIGTLSKALGTAGGFVCGTQPLIDWLANRARTYVFSTAQPPATSAAAIAALDIVESEPHRREQLLSRATDLRARLSAQGWNTGHSASQIIPLIVGDAKRTLDLARKLRDAGYFIPAIRPPTVPEGESLLRLSLCYHHTQEIIDALTAQLSRLR